jgi:hypothetical protein
MRVGDVCVFAWTLVAKIAEPQNLAKQELARLSEIDGGHQGDP